MHRAAHRRSARGVGQSGRERRALAQRDDAEVLAQGPERRLARADVARPRVVGAPERGLVLGGAAAASAA